AREHAEAAFAVARSTGSMYWTRVTGAALIELRTRLGELDSAEQIERELMSDADTAWPSTIASREVCFAAGRLALARGGIPRARFPCSTACAPMAREAPQRWTGCSQKPCLRPAFW